MSMSLPMDMSAETGAGAGPGPLDHLNDPDRVATRSLYNLQQEISAYRAAKDGRGYVHSSGQCTYAVLKGRVRWELLVFCLIFFHVCMCLWFTFVFFLLCWFCFFNSWTCLGWSSIWAVVDLLASGNGSAYWPGCPVPVSCCTSPPMLAWVLWMWLLCAEIWCWSGMSFLAGF